MTESQPQPIRPAATVIIARDASPQYEIFMLQRTNAAAFAGGMYVFPGGRVDDADGSKDYPPLLSGPSSEQALQQEALGEGWQSYWLAGIRETFEEAGLMLAYDGNEQLLSYSTDNHQRFDDYRQQLHKGDISLAEICRKENLKLAVNQIHFFNRFVTPPGRHRRFDTRFFIAVAPPAQTGFHDGHETINSTWISPTAALEKFNQGEFGLMKVTEKQLETLGQYQSTQELIDMAKNNKDFPTFRPTAPPAD
ncbi:MAG: NUDIX hydrolase [Pseudomonadota bacterium]